MPSHVVATTLQLDSDGRIAVWPASAAQLFGRAAADAIGQPLGALVDPRQRDACRNVVAHVFSDGGNGLVHTMELVAERADASTFPAECSLWYCAGETGTSQRCNVLVRNISSRVRVEETLRQELRELRQLSAVQIEELRNTQSRFVDLVETIDEVFWIADPAITRMLYISPGYERVWGRSCQSLYDDPRSFIEAMHPDDRARVAHDLLQRSGQPFEHEYRIVLPDGQVRWISDRGFPVRGADGQIARYLGVAQDISARKAADEARHREEAADAIAQMAVGLAHDFNNVLGVVVGHLDLAAFALPQDSMALDSLEAALKATLSGAQLAQRLQSVGRAEPAVPRAIDVATAVEGLRSLLRHASASEGPVAVETMERPTITVDQVGFDAALITLAMQVRPGMRGGGRLTVIVDEIGLSASDDPLPPGRYARIVVDVDGPNASALTLSGPQGDAPSRGRLRLVENFLSDAGGMLQVGRSGDGGHRYCALLPVTLPELADDAPAWVLAAGREIDPQAD